jgi:general secretion pathway protein B
MSYILDALRKSERERQQAEPLALNAIGSDAIELPRRRVGLTAATAAIVFGAVALSAYWLFASNRLGVAPATTTVPPTTEASVSKSALQAAPSGSAATAIRPAPELKPNPFVAAQPRPAARDLAKEARVRSPSPPVSESSDAARPAPITAPAEVVVLAAPPAIGQDAVKFLRAMPAEFQRELPELTVTIHIYAPREVDRLLYINDRQYRAGEQVREGVVVEEIVPDGALLKFRGQRFKLPRPT